MALATLSQLKRPEKRSRHSSSIVRDPCQEEGGGFGCIEAGTTRGTNDDGSSNGQAGWFVNAEEDEASLECRSLWADSDSGVRVLADGMVQVPQ